MVRKDYKCPTCGYFEADGNIETCPTCGSNEIKVVFLQAPSSGKFSSIDPLMTKVMAEHGETDFNPNPSTSKSPPDYSKYWSKPKDQSKGFAAREKAYNGVPVHYSREQLTPVKTN